MERKTIITRDGSPTIEVPALKVTYHSLHGAITESQHVFISHGLDTVPGNNALHIFEMGFGTGLNALLTLVKADSIGRYIHYTAIDIHPLSPDVYGELNYCERLNQPAFQPLFENLHKAPWDVNTPISTWLTLHKIKTPMELFSSRVTFDLIYYDAFAPSSQPELWSTDIFRKLIDMMATGGKLVTYCSKGDVRRSMQAAGFSIEKLQGPPGKREMLRATKLASSA